MTKLLTRLALSAAIALLFLGLCAAASCASAEKTKISRADENLTYGDTLGQDADEMIDLLEEG
jgi:hypothetical protein